MFFQQVFFVEPIVYFNMNCVKFIICGSVLASGLSSVEKISTLSRYEFSSCVLSRDLRGVSLVEDFPFASASDCCSCFSHFHLLGRSYTKLGKLVANLHVISGRAMLYKEK